MVSKTEQSWNVGIPNVFCTFMRLGWGMPNCWNFQCVCSSVSTRPSIRACCDGPDTQNTWGFQQFWCSCRPYKAINVGIPPWFCMVMLGMLETLGNSNNSLVSPVEHLQAEDLKIRDVLKGGTLGEPKSCCQIVPNRILN